MEFWVALAVAGVSGGLLVTFVFGLLLSTSFSFSALAEAALFDFDDVFEELRRLRNELQRPLVGSSSAKSESSDCADSGRVLVSIGAVVDDRRRELGDCMTPSKETNGPALVARGLSLRMMRKRLLGAGLHACVEGKGKRPCSDSSTTQR